MRTKYQKHFSLVPNIVIYFDSWKIYRLRHITPEDNWRAEQPDRCEYFNQYEDNCLRRVNNLNEYSI